MLYWTHANHHPRRLMATPKVEWRGLRYVDGNHSYYLDGPRVGGVTTIIKNGVPNHALKFWSANYVASWVATRREEVMDLLRVGTQRDVYDVLRKAPWDYRDERAARGTLIHELADALITDPDSTVEVPDEVLDDVLGHVEWMDRTGAIPLFTETSVGNREHRYAGRGDFLGYLPELPALLHAQGDERWTQYGEGDLHLVDWKTAKRIYAEVADQCAAYARAEFYVLPGSADPRALALQADANRKAFARGKPVDTTDLGTYAEVPMPKVDHIHGLHVTPTGSELYPLGDIDAAFQRFLHAKAVADDLAARATCVGEPFIFNRQEAAA